MRTSLLALSFIVASTLVTMAAEPAKMADSQSGKFLVTQQGLALYTFDKDANGKSTCDAKCLMMWPAFYAEEGAMSEGDFSVVKATNGKNIWAYKGMPLYRYHEDMIAGEAKGDGKGGVWHVVK